MPWNGQNAVRVYFMEFEMHSLNTRQLRKIFSKFLLPSPL